MLKTLDTQFKLMEDGRVFYQVNATNPLPGEPVAFLVKGENILKPRLTVLESDLSKTQDKGALHEHLAGWLGRYIATVLEPLAGLPDDPSLKGPAKGIAFQVHEAMGIVPRAQIEDLIATLDQDDRRALRQKKIVLGPLLVFIPALNKPAAVRLRALLWGVCHNRTLPVQAPKDGLVSFVVGDSPAEEKAFYQAVGYPVFGRRAIRIDMLGRVISAVYDSATQGTFRARHDMAEWLGCSIEGLYEVLEAMGHRKIAEETAAVISTPEEDAAPVSEETPPVESLESPAGESLPEKMPLLETPDPVPSSAPVKPVLALFRLKKGKAFEKPAFKKPPIRNADKTVTPFPKKQKPESQAYKKPPREKKKFSEDRPERMMQTGPAPRLEDSPFAILGQLKNNADH